MKLSIQNFVDRVNDFKIKNPIEYSEFESVWDIMPPDEFVDVTGEEFEIVHNNKYIVVNFADLSTTDVCEETIEATIITKRCRYLFVYRETYPNLEFKITKPAKHFYKGLSQLKFPKNIRNSYEFQLVEKLLSIKFHERKIEML